MYEIPKSDWKLFREKIGDWQENYMERLEQEYISLLKECGMCTKKWTIAKWKMFNEKRLELLCNKKKKKSIFSKK